MTATIPSWKLAIIHVESFPLNKSETLADRPRTNQIFNGITAEDQANQVSVYTDGSVHITPESTACAVFISNLEF
jgi:hypothetical protein